MLRPGVFRVGVYGWGQPPAEDRESVPFEELRDAVTRVLGAELPMSAPPSAQGMVKGSVNSRGRPRGCSTPTRASGGRWGAGHHAQSRPDRAAVAGAERRRAAAPASPP
ncbi:hypothetical protein ACIBG8_12040 [Nonomuraea sp. NPDC050556]|uniref:hypothetical protein n=1 Tax=Nonomuraea sp. NPDC050556 TaxID=3364369 RepID=UPI0037A11A4F